MNIDHKAEALRLVLFGEQDRIGDLSVAEMHACAALSQVHATLALVEQQRIANLIAFIDAEGGPHKVINHISGGWATVVDQITDELGLA